MVTQEGELFAIYICPNGLRTKPTRLERAPMVFMKSVMAQAKKGLEGDRYNMDVLLGSYSGSRRTPDSKRQVTFAGLEAFSRAKQNIVGSFGLPQTRRNIFTLGIEWQNTTGATVEVINPINLEEKVTFKIGEECEPCDIPDGGELGFKAATTSEWRGGVRAEVTGSGLLVVGFKVLVLS